LDRYIAGISGSYRFLNEIVVYNRQLEHIKTITLFPSSLHPLLISPPFPFNFFLFPHSGSDPHWRSRDHLTAQLDFSMYCAAFAIKHVQ
jgi:hypothetical protein